MEDITKIIDEAIFDEAKKLISEGTGEYTVYHIFDEKHRPIDTYETPEMAEQGLTEYKKKFPDKQLLIDKKTYKSYDDMVETLDNMTEEINEENDNNEMKNENTKDCTECGDQYEKILRGKNEIKESPNVCEKCGKEVCECGTISEGSKKRVIRLTESQMKKLISKIVFESHPGITVTKDAQNVSKKINDENSKEVGKKIKDALTFDGNDNPEFPKPIGKGDKVVAPELSKEDKEYIEDYRGGKALDLTYDQEPSKEFKERLTNSLEGDPKTGNSQEDDGSNLIKNDTGKEMLKNSERKIKKVKKDPMYKKDVQPVNESKKDSPQVIDEINKMKKLYNYQEKTQ